MAVCIECQKVTGFLDIRDGKCSTCRKLEDEHRQAEATALEMQALGRDRLADVSTVALDGVASALVLTTGFDIPGRVVGSIVDIVGAEVAISTNIFKDIANAWRDTVGGRSNTVQIALRDARTQCLVELRREAFRLGADAVIAVRFAYSEASVATGTGGGILFVSATGTAVSLVD